MSSRGPRRRFNSRRELLKGSVSQRAKAVVRKRGKILISKTLDLGKQGATVSGSFFYSFTQRAWIICCYNPTKEQLPNLNIAFAKCETETGLCDCKITFPHLCLFDNSVEVSAQSQVDLDAGHDDVARRVSLRPAELTERSAIPFYNASDAEDELYGSEYFTPPSAETQLEEDVSTILLRLRQANHSANPSIPRDSPASPYPFGVCREGAFCAYGTWLKNGTCSNDQKNHYDNIEKFNLVEGYDLDIINCNREMMVETYMRYGIPQGTALVYVSRISDFFRSAELGKLGYHKT